MAQKDLIPINKRPKAEQQRIQAMAVDASRKARAKRKEMKEMMQILLSLPAIDSKAKKKLVARGFDPSQVDNMAILIDALWRRAAEGNVFALKEVRNLMGQDDGAALVKIKKKELGIKEKEFELKRQMMLGGDDDTPLSSLKIEIIRASKRVGD